MAALPNSSKVFESTCFKGSVENFPVQQTNHIPAISTHNALKPSSSHPPGDGHSVIVPNTTQPLLGHHQDGGPLPEQPALSTFYIACKVHIKRMIAYLSRLGNKVREISIGTGSFSITLNSTRIEESCYVEYVPSRKRWRATLCPSGILLRLVEESEFTHGCQELLSAGGCTFKAASSTPTQAHKPLEVSARCFRNVMKSMGLCIVDSNPLYHVYVSRIGRSIKVVVTIVPYVNEQDENVVDDEYVQGNVLVTRVAVIHNESITAVVHRLRTNSKNVATSKGRGKRKISRGENSIVLM